MFTAQLQLLLVASVCLRALIHSPTRSVSGTVHFICPGLGTVVSLPVTNWSCLAWVVSVSIAINSWSGWEWSSFASTLTVSNVVMEVIEESQVLVPVTHGVVCNGSESNWVSGDLIEPVDSECTKYLTDVFMVDDSSV